MNPFLMSRAAVTHRALADATAAAAEIRRRHENTTAAPSAEPSARRRPVAGLLRALRLRRAV